MRVVLQKRTKTWKRGISVALTTVILVGVMLTTIGIALFYSQSLIEYYSQLAEFENNKSLMLYAADAIEQISLGSGGSRYVRFSLRTSKLDFIRDYLPTTEVYVTDGAKTIKVLSDKPDVLILEGGSLIGLAGFKMLRPEIEHPEKALNESRRMLVGPGEVLVTVYENQTDGAKVFLLAKRIRVNYLGTYVIVSGGIEKWYNVYEVVYIVLNITRVGGSGNIAVIFECVGTDVESYIFDSPQVTVEVYQDGKLVESKTLSGESSVDGSLVVVRIAYVNIRTSGAG